MAVYSRAAVMAELEASLESMDEIAPNAKLMFFGKSGSGKTVLSMRVAQLITPPDKEIVYIDFKEGWVSLLNHEPALRRRVKRMVYQGYSQLEALVDAIHTREGSFANVGCVISDEHSSMAQDDLEIITRTRAKTDKDKDPDTPTWPDMNTGGLRARRNLNELLSLDMHVILVAHERDDKDKAGVLVVGPSYLPKTTPKILEPLHFAGRCTAIIKEGGSRGGTYERSVQCHPSRTVTCKSRIGGLNVFESHESLITKINDWLQSGGVPGTEAKQVILQDEQAAMDPELIDDAAITVD